ncbi:MAG TPA: PQQ-dependent sugar dehydrogenase, partial [Acidobacteria bacterium]|nr:PQQ-dependent sugar dehydrogenase [Acidobacteriota bacterium]
MYRARITFRSVKLALWLLVIVITLSGATLLSQNRRGASSLRGVPALPPPDRPVVLYTAEHPRIRVVPIVSGLEHPWGIAFRRNGDILVTERDRGTLRVIRNGQLLDRDIPGVPEVYTGVRLSGLMDVAVHPEDDTLVYLTYSKPEERDGQRGATVALARGRLDAGAGALTEVRDIFVADGWGGGISASRLHWAADGKLFMSVGGAFQFAETGAYAQDSTTHFGKLLRLNDDGTAPVDNPFVNNADYLPEIYSMGHRNQLGLAFHPETGDLWATENGPQGGDEANIIKPGMNYGWPIASYSRQYSGLPSSETPWLAEFESPEVVWWPSIAPSGLTFYTGEQFPAWKGNLFVGSMMLGRMQHTGHLERIVFNRRGQEIRRESLLTELKQRIRDVQQGPDGYLYVLTEEDNSVLLRIEPARAITEWPGTIVPAVRLNEARIEPLPESSWTADQQTVAAKYTSGGNSRNVLETLIRQPALANRVFP